MKKRLIQSQLLAASLVLLMGACSSDSEFLGQSPEEPGSRAFTFEISTPASDKLTVNDGYTRAVGDVIEDNATECAVKCVDIFVFARDAGSTGDFTYDSKYSFSVSNSDLEGTANEELVGTLNGSSSMKCTIDFAAGWNNKQLHFVLIANEPTLSPTVTKGSTTLVQFRGNTATVTPADGAQCETLVGIDGEQNSQWTWFPMSAEVETDGAASHTGENFSVKLVRNVARIDVENNTPNLVITEMKLTGANNTSCIMAADNGINVPVSQTPVSLLPLKSSLSPENPFKYDALITGYDTATPSEEQLRDANTRTCFYLYEQANSEDSHVSLVITYRLMYPEDVYQEQTLTIPFKSGDAYIDVKRNNLYKVVIGDGGEVKTTVANATIEVGDWVGHRVDENIDINGQN